MQTINEIQQQIAEYSGYKQETIWDKIESDEVEALNLKLQQIFPNQKNPKDQKMVDEVRSIVFKSVWDQRKYTNGYLLSSIFYAAVTQEMDSNFARGSKTFSLHPVFRTQKCTVNGDGNDTKNCCMIYIDEVGRIYQNFKSYINENVLPPGLMVLPPRGVYTFDTNNTVELVVYETPNSKYKAVKTFNNVMSLASVPAAAIPIVALGLPVAAPILAASSLICGVAGLTSTIICGNSLLDRSKHGQSIDIKDSQARSSWFGVVGGSIGLSAMGSMKLLKSLSTAGRATTGLEAAVNVLNIASLAANGSSVANGFVHLIQRKQDNEPISATECIQMAASLVLFTHSVYNFQLASRIVDDARTGRINDYRKSLSNRQRKMFEKLSKETIRIRGNANGKVDIIRMLNDMPDAQYLNDLNKVNKHLNRNNVRPAFARGDHPEGIVLNDQVPVDTSVLRQNVQHGQGPSILKTVTESIPPTNGNGNKINFTNTVTQKPDFLFTNICNTKIMPHELSGVHLDLLLKEGIIYFSESLQISLRKLGEKFFERIVDLEKFSEYLKHVYYNHGETVLNIVLHIIKRFIEEFLGEFKNVITANSILFKILLILETTYKSCYDLDWKQIDAILNLLQEYFKAKEPQPRQGIKKRCPDCKNFYTISN